MTRLGVLLSLLLSSWPTSGRAQDPCEEEVQGRLSADRGALVFATAETEVWLTHEPDSEYSTVLPAGGGAVAVRTVHLDAPPWGRDELVRVVGPQLAVTPLYRSGRRLLLLGVRRGHVAVVELGSPNGARVVAVRLDDGAVLTSPALPLDLAAYDHARPHTHHDHRALPFDAGESVAPTADGFRVACEGGPCDVVIGAAGVDVRRAVGEAPSPSDEGLPVDGRAESGAPITASRCAVGWRVRVPGARGAECTAHARAPAAPGSLFDVVVPTGCELVVGIEHRALALRRRDISIEPLPDGRHFRVRVRHPSLAAFGRGDCLLGDAWLELGRDRLTTPWESGYCE